MKIIYFFTVSIMALVTGCMTQHTEPLQLSESAPSNGAASSQSSGDETSIGNPLSLWRGPCTLRASFGCVEFLIDLSAFQAKGNFSQQHVIVSPRTDTSFTLKLKTHHSELEMLQFASSELELRFDPKNHRPITIENLSGVIFDIPSVNETGMGAILSDGVRNQGRIRYLHVERFSEAPFSDQSILQPIQSPNLIDALTQ